MCSLSVGEPGGCGEHVVKEFSDAYPRKPNESKHDGPSACESQTCGCVSSPRNHVGISYSQTGFQHCLIIYHHRIIDHEWSWSFHIISIYHIYQWYSHCIPLLHNYPTIPSYSHYWRPSFAPLCQKLLAEAMELISREKTVARGPRAILG